MHLRPGARYTVRVAALNGVSGPAAASGATYAQVTVSTGPGGKVFRTRRAPLSRPPRASPQPATTTNKLRSLVLHKNPRPRRPPPRSAPLLKARQEGLKMLKTVPAGHRGYECSASLREPVRAPLSRPGSEPFPHTQLCSSREKEVEDSAVFCPLGPKISVGSRIIPPYFLSQKEGPCVCPLASTRILLPHPLS